MNNEILNEVKKNQFKDFYSKEIEKESKNLAKSMKNDNYLFQLFLKIFVSEDYFFFYLANKQYLFILMKILQFLNEIINPQIGKNFAQFNNIQSPFLKNKKQNFLDFINNNNNNNSNIEEENFEALIEKIINKKNEKIPNYSSQKTFLNNNKINTPSTKLNNRNLHITIKKNNEISKNNEKKLEKKKKAFYDNGN